MQTNSSKRGTYKKFNIIREDAYKFFVLHWKDEDFLTRFRKFCNLNEISCKT